MSRSKIVKAVEAPLGQKPGDHRWVIVSRETGEVLDDSQGYGFKSPEKAYMAWDCRNGIHRKKRRKKDIRKAVRSFLEEHQDVEEALAQASWDVTRGAYGPGVRFNKDVVSDVLDEFGYSHLPFTAGDLLNYW